MEYPRELHDKHNLYLLAPEQVTDDMLSTFQRRHFPSICGAARKLVPNLHDKKKYVIHYQNLQLYVSLGKKIGNSVIQFEQSRWMKPYIDMNIEKRKEATRRGDKAGKDLWRILANGLVK